MRKPVDHTARRIEAAAAGILLMLSCVPVGGDGGGGGDGAAIPGEVRAVCLDAGFREAEVTALLPDLQLARDAGAVEADVLMDAQTACMVCAEPDSACAEAPCRECFAGLVRSVFAITEE